MNDTMSRAVAAVFTKGRQRARRNRHLVDPRRGAEAVTDRDVERIAADMTVLRGRAPHN
ncbi:hypothetical protein [Rhodococcus sp. Q]|uniref:hypothetical protein n=1 Tax=Rhodococcus sp. Q TaxID=2502252 RepID=UPI001484C8AD|nr:hypothetical protein [Rhodococcus sp. Q]